jgi:hypothetical protein
VSSIRDATWTDFEAVVALSGPAVEADHIRQRWNLPGYDIGWVAIGGERVLGHVGLDATQEASVVAETPAVGDALLERLLARARERGFSPLTITAASDDESLTKTRPPKRVHDRSRDPAHVALARR